MTEAIKNQLQKLRTALVQNEYYPGAGFARVCHETAGLARELGLEVKNNDILFGSISSIGEWDTFAERAGDRFSDAALRELWHYYKGLPGTVMERVDLSGWAEINASELRALAGYDDIGHMTDPQEECRPDFEIVQVRQPDREKPDANNPWHGYETDTYLVERRMK